MHTLFDYLFNNFNKVEKIETSIGNEYKFTYQSL